MQYKDRPLLQRRNSLDSKLGERDPNAKLKSLVRSGSFDEGHKALMPKDEQQPPEPRGVMPIELSQSADESLDDQNQIQPNQNQHVPPQVPERQGYTLSLIHI